MSVVHHYVTYSARKERRVMSVIQASILKKLLAFACVRVLECVCSAKGGGEKERTEKVCWRKRAKEEHPNASSIA